MNNSVEGKVYLVLVGVLVLLLAINLALPWQVYKQRVLIKTDNPSGSSLAERYLILGDWPSSPNGQVAIDDFETFNLHIKDKHE